MCPSPSKASVMHVTMNEKYSIWRKTDLFWCKYICKLLQSFFQIGNIKMQSCTEVERIFLYPDDDHKVPRLGVGPLVDVIMNVPHPTFLLSH